MRISYRKELEKAARQMILIHRSDTLIKLILRTIVRNLKVSHAGIFLFDKYRRGYVLNVSRGKKGIKIPSGLVKIAASSPLVHFFSHKYHTNFDGILSFKTIKKLLTQARVKKNTELKRFYQQLLYQLTIYKIKVALPIIFHEDLLGIFILGEKNNKNDFFPDELTFLLILSSDVAMAIRNASLFEDLKIQLEKNQNLFVQTVAALAEAIEAKDKYTIGHTERVVEYSLKIAQELKKMRCIKDWDIFQNNLKIAALLHDIGKIGIPEKILNKKQVLTEKDWVAIKRHPIIGEGILSPIKDLESVIVAVRYHHERYDGKGYPQGLKGKRIPLIAAIVSVADAYDAMISDRPYRKAFSKYEALKIIQKNSGLQFHPKVVDAFIKVFWEENILVDHGDA